MKSRLLAVMIALFSFTFTAGAKPASDGKTETVIAKLDSGSNAYRLAKQITRKASNYKLMVFTAIEGRYKGTKYCEENHNFAKMLPVRYEVAFLNQTAADTKNALDRKEGLPKAPASATVIPDPAVSASDAKQDTASGNSPAISEIRMTMDKFAPEILLSFCITFILVFSAGMLVFYRQQPESDPEREQLLLFQQRLKENPETKKLRGRILTQSSGSGLVLRYTDIVSQSDYQAMEVLSGELDLVVNLRFSDDIIQGVYVEVVQPLREPVLVDDEKVYAT